MQYGKIFETFVNGPVIKGDAELIQLIKEAIAWTDCSLHVPNFHTGTFEFLDTNLCELLGIPLEDFYQKGILALIERTLPADLPRLAAQQSMYSQIAHHKDFLLTTPLIQHFQWTAVWPNGVHIPLEGVGIILTFTDLREFQVGLGFLTRQENEYESVLSRCRAHLIKIKERHNQIYQHAGSLLDNTPFVTNYTDQTYLVVTKRERQILQLLAKGNSTKEVADLLELSTHTVESHRKNLIQKLEVKNTVELVARASRYFGFE